MNRIRGGCGEKKRYCCRDMIDWLDGMRKQSKNTEAVAVGEKEFD